jgi:hypothetical protein
MKAASDRKKEDRATMRSIGKTLVTLIVTIIALSGSVTQAKVTASLDRDRVAMGDTLRLTIAATDGEEVSSADLRDLQANFTLLQRSTSSNSSWVNGKTSHTKELVISIAPLREGNLQIPGIRVGQLVTNPLAVTVSSAADMNTGGENVIFEAEVDRSKVYVQSQVILTLRILQAINLDDLSISELKLDSAFVKALEQKTFRRNINGRQWLVHEVRYAIFPEQSGTLEIPQQAFSGRMRQQRRSRMDFRNSGALVQRSTLPIAIEVKPRAATFSGNDWLPARQVTLEERWSTPPEQLRAGESATRTIRIMGEGVQGAQLPPVTFPPIEGLKFYPDQPDISENEVASGLLGARQDSAALVPTRAGSWSIPEIRVPWWDTETEQTRFATLPARTITVAAADPATGSGSGTGAPAMDILTSPATATNVNGGDALPWQILSAISVAGWILTLLYLLWQRGRSAVPATITNTNSSEKQVFKQVVAVCNSGDAAAARQAIIAWASAHTQKKLVSLEQVIAVFQNAKLKQALQSLDTSLYSTNQENWQGADLADCVRMVRADYQQRQQSQNNAPLQLYPQGN